MFRLTVLAVVLGVSGAGFAQAPDAASALAPAQLPGKGLAQHDFLYAGESHDRRIFIVRQGKIVWSYDDPAGKGEIRSIPRCRSGGSMCCLFRTAILPCCVW